jgi:hypothetical protein
MRLPSRVHIMDVGPRDGFQIERAWIPTETKIEIINVLARAGSPPSGRKADRPEASAQSPGEDWRVEELTL